MNGTTLTLYDFLNYVVIGALMLLTCNIKPNTINEWLYFVLAYIVGLIIVKLHENTIWYSCFRNPKCLIENGKRELTRTKSNPVLNQYYKEYYNLLGDKTSRTITILEAQFAFVLNLLIPVVSFLLISCFCKERILWIFQNDNLVANDNCCCCMQSLKDAPICICPILLSIVVLSFGAIINFLYQYIVGIISECINRTGVFPKQCPCQSEKNIGLFSKKCTYLFLLVIILYIFSISFLSFICLNSTYYYDNNHEDLMLQRIDSALAVLLILLPILAFHIQKKISSLVAEGNHYMDNKK